MIIAIHVNHLLVAHILSVVTITVLPHAHAHRTIWVLRQTVDLSAWYIPNVQATKLALMKNVGILVLVLVE
jgi:hypothetical protein